MRMMLNVMIRQSQRSDSQTNNEALELLYLDVDEQLPQVAWRHDDGGVELNDVALVQSDVMVGGESLENKSS